MSDSEEELDEYLDVDDGCGCAEVWEELSARRREEHSATAEEQAADD